MAPRPLVRAASALASVDHERMRDRLVPTADSAPCTCKRLFKLALLKLRRGRRPSVRPDNPVGADSLGRVLSKQHRQLVSDVAGLKTAIGAL